MVAVRVARWAQQLACPGAHYTACTPAARRQRPRATHQAAHLRGSECCCFAKSAMTARSGSWNSLPSSCQRARCLHTWRRSTRSTRALTRLSWQRSRTCSVRLGARIHVWVWVWVCVSQRVLLKQRGLPGAACKLVAVSLLWPQHASHGSDAMTWCRHHHQHVQASASALLSAYRRAACAAAPAALAQQQRRARRERADVQPLQPPLQLAEGSRVQRLLQQRQQLGRERRGAGRGRGKRFGGEPVCRSGAAGGRVQRACQ